MRLAPLLSALLPLALLAALPAAPGLAGRPADEAPGPQAPVVAPPGGPPSEPTRPVAPQPIDLAICLDTSGSMQGLIDAARQKLWSLVNELAQARPTPTLRVALLTYGSPGSADPGHVVVQTDLTQDLDLVSERLFALGTNGGEELVGRVVGRALDTLAWSPGRGLRLIFVAGNESADQDRERPFRAEAERAVKQGALVNAIYCGGPDDGDAALWRELALVGKGRFASIDHNHGTLAVATPFDKQLAELGRRLNTTYVWAGREAREKDARQEAQDENARAAGAPAAAERAVAKASGLYRPGDLLDRLAADPTFDLGTLKDDELPDELKAVAPAERKAWIEKRQSERTALAAEVRELDQKRAQFVQAEMKRRQLSDVGALDRALRDAIREQASARGFAFDAPAR